MITRIILAGALALGALAGLARADYTFPQRIGQREFVLDEAGLLSSSDKAQVQQLADRCLTDRAVPIIVVTVEELSKYGSRGSDIESYTRELFDHWGIGFQELRGKLGGEAVSWNRGMLLLVSKRDRKARIELGADWNNTKLREMRQIMDTLIVPRFKAGDYSQGIVYGVTGLDAIARQLKIPNPPLPWWYWPAVVLTSVLIVTSVYNICTAGQRGWGWALWATLLTFFVYLLIFLLKAMVSGGSAGYSGGSFGGGSGGGGGATGSW